MTNRGHKIITNRGNGALFTTVLKIGELHRNAQLKKFFFTAYQVWRETFFWKFHTKVKMLKIFSFKTHYLRENIEKR